MWLFCKRGFVSIVQHKDQPDMLLVRARCRSDIDQFRDMLEAYGCEAEVHETPVADYAYRLTAPKDAVARTVAALVQGIDYTNFKDCVHGEPAIDEAYMACWWAMKRFQNSPRP